MLLFNRSIYDHPAVQEAIGRRKAWLVEQGFATRGAEDGRIALQSDALGRLASSERMEVREGLAEKHRRPVEALPLGGSASGTYAGTRTTHGGVLAVVITDDRVVVARVRRPPDIDVGSAVALSRPTGRNAVAKPIAGRPLNAGADRAGGGLEASR